VDITDLILDDHHEQRRLFAILEQIDPADTATLNALWSRISTSLELHAAAEEAIFYPALIRAGAGAGDLGGAEEETLDAIHDHNEIRDAIAAVAGHETGSGKWSAAVAAVNLANSDHMAEEEREGLTDFRRRATLQLRHDLAVAFTAFEASHFAGVPAVDRDPAGYVREVEEAAGPPGSGPPAGSLGIGSMKRH
jgi:Hemerythrin HHE cation binding domain